MKLYPQIALLLRLMHFSLHCVRMCMKQRLQLHQVPPEQGQPTMLHTLRSPHLMCIMAMKVEIVRKQGGKVAMHPIFSHPHL